MTIAVSKEELYQDIEEIIMEHCDLEDLGVTKIKETDRLIGDLGIDSVDFLNVIFDIEKKFGIEIPSEEWMNKASEQAPGDPDDYFLMSNFVSNVLELIEDAD